MVSFDIEEQEDEPFCRRQLHHRPLQMNTFYIFFTSNRFGFRSADALTTRLDSERKSSHRSELTDFSQEGLVQVVGSGIRVERECAQKSLLRQLLCNQLIVRHPK